MHQARPIPAPSGLESNLAAGWLVAALDLVFPPRCAVCGRDPGDGVAAEPAASIVCGGCEEAVSGQPVPRCDRCGEPLPPAGSCGRCRRRPWRSIAVLGGYDGFLRQAVLRGKRVAGEGVCRGLASLWLRRHEAAARGWGCDCVVPVPLHWTRRIARATSSADTLAATVARGLGLPLSRSLRRIRRTRMQNELPPEERPRNVRAAFRCRGRLPGRRVLLVDDVMTTGATLSACSRALTAAGAEAVFVATMARADRSDTRRSQTP